MKPHARVYKNLTPMPLRKFQSTDDYSKWVASLVNEGQRVEQVGVMSFIMFESKVLAILTVTKINLWQEALGKMLITQRETDNSSDAIMIVGFICNLHSGNPPTDRQMHRIQEHLNVFGIDVAFIHKSFENQQQRKEILSGKSSDNMSAV